MTATSTYLNLPCRSESAVRRIRSATDGHISQPHWTPARAEDLVNGARVGYRGSYGLTSMREGTIEGGMMREEGDYPSWTVRLDCDSCTRWGYLHQFYVNL